MASSSTQTTEEEAELAQKFASFAFSQLTRSGLTAQNAMRWHERFVMMSNTFAAGRAKTAQYIRDTKRYEVGYYASAQAYIAHCDGISYGDACRLLDMQDRLDNLPRLQEAFDLGLLSLQKVQLVAEGATLDSDSFDRLLEIAYRETLPALEAKVRVIKASKDPKSGKGATKSARLRWRANGPYLNQLIGVFTNEQRAVIDAKLEPETERVFRQMSKDGTFESRAQCAAIALVNIFSMAGDGKAPRAHFLITADFAAVESGEKTIDDLCNIPGIGPVERGILFRYLSDVYVDVDVQTSDVVDEQPQPSRRIRRAKHNARPTNPHAGHRSSPGYKISEEIRRKLKGNGGHICAMRGCDIQVGLDCDHNHEWRDGGSTCECNLEFLCRRHHGMKTRERLMLAGPRGSRYFVPMRAGP